MWLNKILWILLALALLIFAFRALLNRQQKQAVHQTVAFIAKVILIVASILALWTFLHRYF